MAADYVRVASGQSQWIKAFGACLTVTNSNTQDIMVPTKNPAGWLSFRNTPFVNVSKTYQNCTCLSLRHLGVVGKGLFTVDLDGPGPQADSTVYCDNDTDGGGWTLIGRSVSGGSSSSFGFTSNTGSPSIDTAPYSMAVSLSGLTFTEVLFGAYTSGKTWGPDVFRKTFNSDERLIYSVTTTAATPTTTVIGSATPSMFALMGKTSLSTTFWFRDCDASCGPSSAYGLSPSGWVTVPGNNGGNISTLQGMIMVR
jgi:hypothetical protein